MIRTLITVTILSATPAFANAPSPVADPTGTLTGEIDGARFDLPVVCEEESGWLFARSHRISFDSDPTAVDAAVEIAMPGGMLGVTALVNGRRYEFGALGVETGRQLSYSGTIGGDDGEYGAAFELDCDG